jgi:hypothetical protein
MALNIPGLKTAAAAPAGDPARAGAPGWMRGRLPLIGHLPLALQVRILGAALLLFIVLATVLVWQDLVGTRNNATHIQTAGQMRSLIQGIAGSAPRALAGDPAALTDLARARSGFTTLLESVLRGGEVNGVTLPAASGEALEQLLPLDTAWADYDRNAGALLSQEKNLRTIAEADPGTRWRDTCAACGDHPCRPSARRARRRTDTAVLQPVQPGTVRRARDDVERAGRRRNASSLRYLPMSPRCWMWQASSSRGPKPTLAMLSHRHAWPLPRR